MKTIVSWGEILWDRFPAGDVLGGAPANVSFCLGRQAVRSVLVSRVGDDEEGHRAVAALSQAGVDVACIQIDPDRVTGEVGVELAPSGEAIYTLFPGRAWERIECGAREREVLSTAAAFCFGTLAQRCHEGRAAHMSAIQQLPAGAWIVCDPNLRSGFSDWELVRESLAAANAVKINEAEASWIMRETGAADAAQWLHHELATEVVACTLGKHGCVISRASGERVAHDGFGAKPGGDNVGCGDAFTAMFAFGLTRDMELAAIAELANCRASEVAGHRGATSH